VSRPKPRGRLRGDQGAATAWAILMVAVVGLLCGAVLDGGNAMAAKVAALDIAQQAARAGANALDLNALREAGLIRLDPAAADAAARRFLDDSGVGPADSAVAATPAEVTVTVTRTEPTLLLHAVGVPALTATATAHAAPATGP
jgi:Flp pilus assembly protein TadG